MVTDPHVASPAVPTRVAHLLDIARAAFVAEGFDGVSIDAIARQAGVSKETIYRYFPDKQALFRASLKAMASRFEARALALHHAHLPDREELGGLAQAILDAAVHGGLLSPLWLAAGLGGRMPDFAAELQKAQAAQIEPVRETIEAIVRTRGISRPVPIDDALDFGSLAVEGSALLMGFDPPPVERRAALAARVAALFEQGVLAMPRSTALAKDGDLTPLPLPPVYPPHLRRLLDVAAAHFLRDGYEAASLGAIGAEAKVGRGTLYRHFAHKAGLFDAVMRDLAAQIAHSAQPPALPLKAGPDAVAAAVAAFFASATAHLTAPASIALHRATIAAARRDPALARAVHDTVRVPWIAPLAQWIAHAIGPADAQWLARQGIVLAMQGNRAIAAGRGPAAEVLTSHAHRTTRLFLHGLGG
ncbi:TetR/AcrR family transcriptional regulator [Novosphingobium sp. ERN07]|nr:TetR/AcrR family transcriptional regulator [Novosphingobium sp. ERN07]